MPRPRHDFLLYHHLLASPDQLCLVNSNTIDLMFLRFRSTSRRTTSTRTDNINSDPDINELNTVLTQLSEIYPHHDSSQWRQAILWHASKSTTSSRLEAAADRLAHTPQPELGLERTETGVQPWELFRTEAYQSAVSRTL